MITYLIISMVSLTLLLYITLSEKSKPEKTIEPIDTSDLDDFEDESIQTTDLLMEYEQDYYYRIQNMLPDNVLMHCQVSFSAFLTSKTVKIRNSFNRAHCDVLITTLDFKVLLIIEIDGSSHRSHRVQARDRKRDNITQSAGIPTIRIDDSFSDRTIKRLIEKEINQKYIELNKIA